MSNNIFYGKKVEKGIRYNEILDTYYVQFHFGDRVNGKLRSFPTLEDARAYRDAVYKAKLETKIKEDEAKIYASDRTDAIYSNLSFYYPENIYKAMQLNIEEINPVLFDGFKFNEIMNKFLNEREQVCIKDFYEDGKSCEKIAHEYGVTRERIRQIIAKATRKLRRYIANYDSILEVEAKKRLEEKNLQDLMEKRAALVNEMRNTGCITEEMNIYFGQIEMSPKDKLTHMSIEDLDLSIRSWNCLRRARIETVAELIALFPDDILKIKNLGRKSYKEIVKQLKDVVGYEFKEDEE